MIRVSSLSFLASSMSPPSRRNAGRGRIAAWTLAGALLAALPAAAADRILDVRVGRHDEFTRIVFELDGSATHQVEQKPGATELVVRLGATSSAREILSNSDIVQSVRLEPKGGETIARVVLRTSRVRVSELTLESPPRLVLDVRPGEPAPAVAQAKPVAPPPAPAPSPAPAPKPAPPVAVAKPAAPPSAPLGAAPAPPSDVEEEVEEVEEIDETEVLVQADTEAASDDAADAAASADAAAAATPGAPIKPAPSLAPPVAPSVPKPAPAPGLPPATVPAERGPGALIPEGVDPRWVGGIVALLAAFLLWGLFRRRDRTTREVEAADQAPANVFADREPTSAWAPEAASAAVAPTIEVPREEEAAEAAPPSDLPLFTPRPAEAASFEADAGIDVEAITEAEAEPAGEAELPAPVERATPRHLSVVPVEPPAAPEPATTFGAPLTAPAPASFDVGSRVADLERRIALLERKLEDAADVRERLERQVVAQTEELRVQRAAIARTQRVLRTLARPDDLPIEPAPRGSGPTGSGT